MMPFLNDGSEEAPKLRFYLNADNLIDLRQDTKWGGASEGLARLEALASDGWHGYQQTTGTGRLPQSPLRVCGLDRISEPHEADPIVRRHVDAGHECITVHAGWGLEDDAGVDRLAEAILTASVRHRLPVFLETHRATITQDLWRTVRLVDRFPEIRFNGDFSHYYCGQEMRYGDFEGKLDFLRPVFERVAFIHARIASPGTMQVSVDTWTARPVQAHGMADYLADFKAIWTAAMRGFLTHAKAGDSLPFCPELLAGTYYYARLFPNSEGRLEEESDRYSQALIYRDIATECWNAARSDA